MKIITCLCLLLYSNPFFAQNIEIRVLNRNTQPMPYAYILINNKPVAIGDNSGKARIPAYKLFDGDTISVSYLGAVTSYVIFNEAIRSKGGHVFILDERMHNPGDAIVEYHDIEKLFRRNNNSIPQLNYNCTMKADFIATLRAYGKTYSVAGKLDAKNEMYSEEFGYRAEGWFHHPLTFTTEDDTAGISRMLSSQTHRALNYIYRGLEWCRNYMLDKYDPFYSYLGENDSNKIFRITYPDNMISYFPFHLILYLDKENKRIDSIELLAIKSDSTKNSNYYKLSITSSCRVYSHKKPLMNTVYLADNLHYSYEIASGKIFEIHIMHPTIFVKNISIPKAIKSIRKYNKANKNQA